MECHMKTRVKAMVEQLAREHQQELAAAGTLVNLEELTAQIGDEFGRQLCENELANRRVKGTEKFWSRSSSEAVLQLRADYLSDSAPFDSFWLRHQTRQTGANAYSQAT